MRMAEGLSKNEKFVRQIDFSSANVAASWKAFKSQFSIYKIAKKLGAMTSEEQICNMLVQMGPDSVQIYEQFKYDEDKEAEKKNLANTITFFDAYFEPVKNVIFERAKFNCMKQGELSIHQFIVSLQQQATYCDYGTVKDDLVRDRVVVGVRDQKLREYLIDLDDLDLAKCIQKAKQYTSNHGQASQFREGEKDNLDVVVGQKQRRFQSVKPELRPSGGRLQSPCFLCGKLFHRNNACPAKETTCKVCNVKGHWARSRACKRGKQAPTHELCESGVEDEMEGLFLESDM